MITHRFRSLRFRLIASVVAIEVVMLSLLVWNNLTLIRQAHADRLRDTAASMLQQIATTSGSYMVEVDYASLEEYLNNIATHPELDYLVVLDRDQHPIIRFGDAGGPPWPRADRHPAEVTDARYDVASDIEFAGRIMGRILMGFSLDYMEQAIGAARVRSVAIAATEIVLSILATVLIGLHLTRRLGALASAAQRVGAGDYQVAVPTGVMDEVGTTAQAFNRMVEEVSQRTRRLEQALARERVLMAERKEAENECRALLEGNRYLIHKSLAVQEEERRHLARELHDELGQCMTAIQADAELIQELAGYRDERVEASARAIVEVSSRMYDVVHSMMRRLRPTMLDDLGLVAALEEAIEDWQARHPDIHCVLTTSGELDQLAEPVNISLYRVVQEVLTNVARHAQARNVEIRLMRERGEDGADRVRLHARDDGRGMNPDRRVTGLGLMGMRERVEALRGTLVLDAAPGRGVAIDIIIPLQGET